MAGSVNKVILVGTLGRDPEVKYMPSGDAIANVTLATNDVYKDKNTGEKKETTEWHRVVFFGRLAENVGKYLTKGRQLYVEGSLRTRKWQGQDGQDRYTTEIIASGMQMLGGRPGGGMGAGSFDESPTPMRGNAGGYGGSSAPSQPNAAPSHDRGFEDFDDDIPF